MWVCYGRGMRPQNKIAIQWSPEFAYAIGLLVTDGCIYSNRKMINLTSKDEEQIRNFMRCLNITNKVGMKSSGLSGEKKYFSLQVGDVTFCDFLNSIGIMPKKTKIIGEVDIPTEYFFDFLRGHMDGDGTFYSYWDSRWRSSFMFYTVFVSASEKHILWIREEIFQRLGIKGHLTKTGDTPMRGIKYAKAESLKLLPKMYYNPEVVCLSRKREKIRNALMVNESILTI
jgi:hypothetical protein